MDANDLAFMPATQLAEEIRLWRLSPVEVTAAILERIERLNPTLNAYCTVTPDLAMDTAHQAETAIQRDDRLGPLHGVPISIKDLTLTKDIRTTRGSRLYENDVPNEDAPVVERVKAAGAIILGKTNTPEFGWKGSTDNLIFGATRNPWDLNRTPGGSSGGASAAVAAGLGPLAIGSDGGGSIRIPCSFTGIFGLKQSFGRVPSYPPSAAATLSHTGPMARTVADVALLLDVISGPDDRDRYSFALPPSNTTFLQIVQEGARQGQGRGLSGTRVAWSADLGYAIVDPEVAAITAAAAQRFAELGCDVEAEDPGFANPLASFLPAFFGGVGAMLAAQPTGWREMVTPGLLELVDSHNHLTIFDFGRSNLAANAIYEAMRHLFTRYDALLTPTVAIPAFPLGIDGPSEVAGQPVNTLGWTPFTFPFNMTGHPAASVPVGFTSGGLPVGLQIVGKRQDDATVLRLAAAYEAAFPWAQHRPEFA